MTIVRRHLPALTLVWLVCQLASVSAFLPPACCVAHQSTEEHACTDAAAAAVCPMHAQTGEVCPMHAAGQGAPDDSGAASDARPDDTCSMRSLCNAPAAALAALLMLPGVVPDATTPAFPRKSAPLAVSRFLPLDRPAPGDTPPPRF